MANPLKGEVDLVAGETTYTLRMSINEIIRLGQLTGLKIKALSAALGDTDDVDLDLWRSALWAALQCHHDTMSLEDAGEIMREASIATVLAKVSEALQLSFPVPEEGEGNPRPPKASRSGTGKRS